MEKMIDVIRCRVEPALKERVERLAQRRYSRPSHVVRDALVEFLDRADARDTRRARRKAAGGTAAAENPQAKGNSCH
jgi:predicted transcriptional regulator